MIALVMENVLSIQTIIKFSLDEKARNSEEK